MKTTKVRRPKGGGAVSGIGESCQAELFTGCAGLSLPILTTKWRGAEPHLALSYSSGGGNGAFGLGFDVPIPSITRKTSSGLPRYDASDTFLNCDAQDLVPALKEEAERFSPAPAREVDHEDGHVYAVTRYRTRKEGALSRIEQWSRQDVSSLSPDIHWRVTSGDNVTSIYGYSAEARIADPHDERRVFRWLLERTDDARHNTTLYEYRPGAARLAADTSGLQDSPAAANKLIRRICYGRYTEGEDSDRWHFEVIFDYSDRSAEAVAAAAGHDTGHDRRRDDPFSSFSAGFELRTECLCSHILLRHQFEGRSPFLVRGLHLTYVDTPDFALLKEASQIGYKMTGAVLRRAAMPPVVLDYTTRGTARGFAPLTHIAKNTSDNVLHQSIDDLVDLFGEGIPGILHSDGHSTYYSRSIGKGAFAEPESPVRFPNTRDLGSGDFRLLDLDGNGHLDLVTSGPWGAGFFEGEAGGQWSGFRPFRSYPTDASAPGRHFADLTGDGRADLVTFEKGRVRYFASLGKAGFAESATWEHDLDLPVTTASSASEYVGFHDVFGDGGSHLLRVRQDVVECWPNLGYGRFGAKRTLVFETGGFTGVFDPARLYFADIDGSGTEDLIYVCEKTLEIYSNRNGNKLSRPEIIALPTAYDGSVRVKVGDILGHGTTCVVVTSRQPDLQLVHHYIDLCGGGKPHLLNRVDNSVGSVKQLSYVPSTRFYLEDMARAHAWRTRLPLPVHVVASVEEIDEIAGTRQLARFAYHDGYYDGTEQAFRGFGYVERWDAELFDEEAGTDTDAQGLHRDDYVAPAYGRTWFHTGAPGEGGRLSNHYRSPYIGDRDSSQSHYYQGVAGGLHLPDSVLEVAAARDLTQADILESCRALGGHRLRQEIYAWHGPATRETPGVPLLVHEQSFCVRSLQPAHHGRPGVFAVFPVEDLTCRFEQQASDPRIEHNFSLAIDVLGNVTRRCVVFYPRREVPADSPTRSLTAQTETRAIASVTRFFPPVDEPDHYLFGVHAEEARFDLLLSAVMPSTGLITRDLILAATDELTPEGAVTHGFPRLLEWVRHFYWDRAFSVSINDTGSGTAALAPQSLLHRSERAVLSVRKATELYGGCEPLEGHARVDAGDNPSVDDVVAKMLADGCKLVRWREYWWDPGLREEYATGPGGHFLPETTTDQFGNATTIEYDDIGQAPAVVTRPGAEVTRIEYDEYYLEPVRRTDVNGTVNEVVLDPLGRVLATSLYGTEGAQAAGDGSLQGFEIAQDLNPETLLDRPHLHLAGASSLHIYENGSWARKANQIPPHSVIVSRRTHGTGKPVPDGEALHVQVTYLDGTRRTLQTKILCDGASGEREAPRWYSSARVHYNNKGLPAHRYAPCYSPSHACDAVRPTSPSVPSQVWRYDVMSRIVRIETPDGFHTSAEFGTWREVYNDAIDTLRASSGYRNSVEGSAERQALDRIAARSDTPEIHDLDSRGRAVRVTQMLDAHDGLATTCAFDASGRVKTVTDARGIRCLTMDYDLCGAPVSSVSSDAGQRIVLHDAGGLPHCEWGHQRTGPSSATPRTMGGPRRATQLRTLYDSLRRPTARHLSEVRGDTLVLQERIVERLVYGAVTPANKSRNRSGRLIRQFDQAGELSVEAYGLHGAPLHVSRRYHPDHKHAAHWSETEMAAFREAEHPAFDLHYVYDAFGRVTGRMHPNRAASSTVYGPEGWVASLGAGGIAMPKKSVRVRFQYNERGQRTGIALGNGVSTRSEFDPRTEQLVRQCTFTATADEDGDPFDETLGSLLQETRFAHDPLGCLIHVESTAFLPGFIEPPVPARSRTYRYDAASQLRHAETETGSDHYRYDRSGNLEAHHHVHDGREPWSRNNGVSQHSNHLTESTPSRGGMPGGSFSYDAHGNTTRLPGISDLVWDYRDRLVSTKTRGDTGTHSIHTYNLHDLAGNRVRQVVERHTEGHAPVTIAERIFLDDYTVGRAFLPDADPGVRQVEIIEVSDGTHCLARIEATAGPQAFPSSARPVYQITDHLGSVGLELDSEGAAISYEDYSPFGETACERFANGASHKTRGYGGQVRDAETGLSYYGNRYYAPWLGRWLNPDPAGLDGGQNLFAFVHNNPATFVDHAGLLPKLPDIVQPRSAADARSGHPMGTARNPTVFQQVSAPPRVLGLEVSHRRIAGVGYSNSLVARVLRRGIRRFRNRLPETHERMETIQRQRAAVESGLSDTTRDHLSNAVTADRVAMVASAAMHSPEPISRAVAEGVRTAANAAAHHEYGAAASAMHVENTGDRIFQMHLENTAEDRGHQALFGAIPMGAAVANHASGQAERAEFHSTAVFLHSHQNTRLFEGRQSAPHGQGSGGSHPLSRSARMSARHASGSHPG